MALLMGLGSLRSSSQTRAKWSLSPQLVQVLPLAGYNFHECGPRRSRTKNMRPVQWTLSSIPSDESAINLFVCLADSIALAPATTSDRDFLELSVLYVF